MFGIDAKMIIEQKKNLSALVNAVKSGVVVRPIISQLVSSKSTLEDHTDDDNSSRVADSNDGHDNDAMRRTIEHPIEI